MVSKKFVHNKKARSKKEKDKLLNRLKRIEGQVRGIYKMVEDDKYCPAILIQASAASKALNAFSTELLERHIKSCVVTDIKHGKEEVVGELTKLIQKMMR